MENIKEIFLLKRNEEAKRFEFTPQSESFSSFTISFEEVDFDKEKAWQMVTNSLIREPKRKISK